MALFFVRLDYGSAYDRTFSVDVFDRQLRLLMRAHSGESYEAAEGYAREHLAWIAGPGRSSHEMVKAILEKLPQTSGVDATAGMATE